MREKTMLKSHNPDTVAPPLSDYHHGMEAPAGARLLMVSGQIGIRSDGSLPDTIEEQCEEAWQNVFRVLDSAGMGPEDLLRVNLYFVRAEDLGAIREARIKMTSEFCTGSTLLRLAGLASPDWLIEIEATAAKV
jgi:enamine deaminase RidA (YjgF/YER057c/UK114 family)